MVDWQFTVFCHEVRFVEIYAFLVLFFLAKNVSLLFVLLFASLMTCHGKDRHPNVGNNDVEEDCLASSPEISYINISSSLLNLYIGYIQTKNIASSPEISHISF